jgi:hypothetical protein
MQGDEKGASRLAVQLAALVTLSGCQHKQHVVDQHKEQTDLPKRVFQKHDIATSKYTLFSVTRFDLSHPV